MRTSSQAQLLGAMGLCLLSAPLGRWAWDQLAAPPIAGSRQTVSPGGPPAIELAPAHSPSGQALREARAEWLRAEQAAARELEAWPEQQPDTIVRHLTDAHRQCLMALDRAGDLRRARAAAQRAAALARTATEAYRAAMVLARIECDAGDHHAELRQARRMMALRPQVRGSWETLKHAAVCNGLGGLARQADAALAKLPITPAPYRKEGEPVGVPNSLP